jgi:formylglycine-generating enzyme required for sulfatase activity
VAQQYVVRGSETKLTLPKHGTTTTDLTLITSGIALLGAELDSPKHLAFDLYEVPPYLLSNNPVSFREYFAFLKFLSETQGKQVALRRSPRSATRGEFRWSDLDFSKPNECKQRLGALYENAITGISFHDARAYCHWLNIEKGPGHRLPNEIEWEKAIRGCLGTRWSWGDLWSATLSQAPSPFGVNLSSGVRLEWTSSSGQDDRYRIARGIGLENETSIEGLSERVFLPEEQVNQHVGFRVAKTCI